MKRFFNRTARNVVDGVVMGAIIGVLVGLLLIFMFPSPAKGDPVPPEVGDYTQSCSAVGDLANTIMEVRQRGTASASDLLSVASPSDEHYPIIVAMVRAAFEEPAYSTQQHQNRAIREFENEWFLACLSANRS